MTVTARRTPPRGAPRPPDAALTDVVAVIITNQVDDEEDDAASCRRSVWRGHGLTQRKSNPTGGVVAGTVARRLLLTAAASAILAAAAAASLTSWTLSTPSVQHALYLLEKKSTPSAAASRAKEEDGPPPRTAVDSPTMSLPSLSSTHASSAAALPVDYEPENSYSKAFLFCVPWEVDTDDWWMHHFVNWTIALEHENATHTCYQRRRRRAHVQSFQRLYSLQFSSNTNCTVRKMWSDGFGSDLRNVMDGLDEALRTQTPFTVDATPWHYVTLQDLSNPACHQHPMAPRRLRNDVTMSCFFLPISNCSNRHQTLTTREMVSYSNRGGRPPSFVKQWALLEYVLRPRQWLRHQVQIELDQQDLKNRLSDAMALDGAAVAATATTGREQRRTTTRSSPSTDSGGGGPCTVVHVRRGDSVLGNSWSTSRRTYRPLSEYLRHVRTRTVLLLTDDANAIEEAHSHFSNFTFVYWNRTRYRGSEGGWEEHLPSRDPVGEMATLLGTFQLVRQCRALIHTSSNLGQLLYAHMVHDRPNGIRRVNLDSISVRGDRDKK